MDSQIKEQLLKLYWQGTSTPEQDEQLRNLAATKPELFSEEERELFLGIQNLQELSLNLSFEDIVKEDSETHVVSIAKPWTAQLWKAAAALILLLGVAWGMSKYNTPVNNKPLVDAETLEAYETAQKALALISTKMLKIKSVTSAFDQFDSTTNRIKKSKN